MIKIVPVSHKKIEDTDIGKGKLYNNGKDELDASQTEIEVYDFQRGSSVKLDGNIETGDTSVSKKEIIKSKVDGEIDYTNIQDSNLNDWNGYWKDLTGTATNQLGISNDLINNVAGLVNDVNELFNPEAAKLNLEKEGLDNSMSKLKQWKANKYKDLHPFDWKPGQTVPQDLMNTSIGSIINNFGAGNATYDNIKNNISVDPISYSRNSMKASKGLLGEKTFRVQSKENKVSYTSGLLPQWEESDESFGGYHKSSEEIKYINALKNKNTFNKTLGYLYIKPNYSYDNDISMEMLQIPFEFNPDISESGQQATYVSETLLNRIGQYQVYTGTNLSQVNINLKYIALSPDNLVEEDNNNLSKQFSTDAWQYYWTNNRIEEIEYKLRSLVFPDITTEEYLIKPPIIEIHIGNCNENEIETVGDLYKYPTNLGDEYLSVSRSVGDGNVNRFKKYIVTNVQIDKIDDDSFIWPSLYGRVWQGGSGAPINHIKNKKNEYARRTGFKATLQCLEVTENFLDIVPDFKAYYNAWVNKNGLANITSDYVNSMLGIGENSINNLEAEILTKSNSLEDRKNILEEHFKKSQGCALIYKDMLTEGSNLFLYNKALEGNSKIDDRYHFINKEYIPTGKETDDPVVFYIPMKKTFDFININSYDNSGNNIYINDLSENNIYDGKMKPYTDQNASINKELFYGANDADDKLNLYNKDKEKLSFLGKENAKKEFKYTDIQCCYLIKRLLKISKELEDSSKKIEIFKEEEQINQLIHMFHILFFLKYETDKEYNTEKEYESFEIYKDVLSKNKIGKYIFKLETKGGDPTIFEDLSHFKFLDKEYYLKKIKELEAAQNIDATSTKMMLENRENKLIYMMWNEFLEATQNKNTGSKNKRKLFFKELKKAMKKEGFNPEVIDIYGDDVEEQFEVCIKNIVDAYNICLSIVSEFYNKDKYIKEIGMHLSYSIISGNKIKCIKSTKKDAEYIFHQARPTSPPTGKPDMQEVIKEDSYNIYDTYTYKEFNIISIVEVNNAMVDAFDNAISDLKKLNDDVQRHYDNGNLLIDLKDITFKKERIEDNEKYLSTHSQEFKKILNNNLNSIISLKERIFEKNKLRDNLNKKNIVSLFHKIAGKPDDSPDKEGVKKLKSLDKEYNNYSKDNKLRESVYKDWDTLSSSDTGNFNDLVVSGNFENSFRSNKNGIIPHDYYDLIIAEENLKKMSIAANASMISIDKLQ